MPLINIKVSASSSPALTAEISALVSDLTSRILGKKADLIATIITYVRPEDWLIGGKTLSEIGVSSFSLEIIVTDETNTKAEKAEYLAEVFACFERLLAPCTRQAMSMSTMRAPRPMATVGGHKKRGSISPDIPVTRISRLKGHCPDKFSGTSIPRSFRRVLKRSV